MDEPFGRLRERWRLLSLSKHSQRWRGRYDVIGRFTISKFAAKLLKYYEFCHFIMNYALLIINYYYLCTVILDNNGRIAVLL